MTNPRFTDASEGSHSASQAWTDQLTGWLAGRLPADWFTAAPEFTVDRDEIVIVGDLHTPDLPDDATDAARTGAIAGRIKQFREDTRARRITIARELEHSTGRKVAWGVTCGGRKELFSTLSVPVMSRLRQPERQVLDTLVEAGVARSRSDAIGWCVRLVGEHAQAWLQDLQDAMTGVRTVREAGPDLGGDPT
jgi:hypothetical protein